MDPLDINLGSVSIFSQYAVGAARRYVNLIEAQLSRAHDEMLNAAVEEYRKINNPDETAYDNYVTVVDRKFENDYQPILRFTEVIYLYMVFETYASHHVAEIQTLRVKKPDILKHLKKKKNNLTEALEYYFQKELNWVILSDDEWKIFLEIAELRNCIIHNAGVARDWKKATGIYSLESRRWRNQPIGLTIDRFQDRDIGQPVVIQHQFLEFFLDLLERFFASITKETHAKYWNRKSDRNARHRIENG